MNFLQSKTALSFFSITLKLHSCSTLV